LRLLFRRCSVDPIRQAIPHASPANEIDTSDGIGMPQRLRDGGDVFFLARATMVAVDISASTESPNVVRGRTNVIASNILRASRARQTN